MKDFPIYMSYAMTAATKEDLALEESTRQYLHTHHWELEFYDPRVCEPRGMSMEQIQEWDFERMGEVDGLLAIWGPSTHKSGGVLEELGWARRVFHIPAVIYRPDPSYHLSTWTEETVKGDVYQNLADALARLLRLMRGEKALKVTV